MPLAIAIHPDDNVATLITSLAEGEVAEIVVGTRRLALQALSAISTGHKIALGDIPAGGQVIKFGQPIGRATRDIRSGDHVHIHNVAGFASGTCEEPSPGGTEFRS